MQLSSMYNNNFLLGHSAMLINEGLPDYIIKNLLEPKDLKNKNVGILGMAFKAEVDDIRDSLSFKLKKVLMAHGAKVLCSDEYFEDESFFSAKEILAHCKVIIIGAPHRAYKKLNFNKDHKVVDIWNHIN
jgi:UDP-N-acetyl-D-mannosaminuronic acid dehydrogenase